MSICMAKLESAGKKFDRQQMRRYRWSKRAIFRKAMVRVWIQDSGRREIATCFYDRHCVTWLWNNIVRVSDNFLFLTLEQDDELIDDSGRAMKISDNLRHFQPVSSSCVRSPVGLRYRIRLFIILCASLTGNRIHKFWKTISNKSVINWNIAELGRLWP